MCIVDLCVIKGYRLCNLVESESLAFKVFKPGLVVDSA